MSEIETSWFDEEKKKKERLKKDEKEAMEKLMEWQKRKEKLHEKIEASEKLSHLKELLEEHKIDEEVIKSVEKIAEDNLIDHEEIKEILAHIEAIHKNPSIKKYLPKNLIITKKEYIAALKDKRKKEKALKKINNALGILAQSVNPTESTGINLFSGLWMLLDKNLVFLQERHIDIKHSLQEKEKKKWFLATLKDIFINP